MLKEQVFGEDGSYFVPSSDVKRKKKPEGIDLMKQQNCENDVHEASMNRSVDIELKAHDCHETCSV